MTRPPAEPSTPAQRARAKAFFEELWAAGDPWKLDTSDLDQARYARMRALLRDRRYGRALELGAGAGAFTRSLSEHCDQVVAVEIAEAATAAEAGGVFGRANVDLRTLDVMDLDLRGEPSFDLVVMSEVIYYLGWLYPVFDVGWLAAELYRATAPGGRLLLVNTRGREEGIHSPWLVDTYRDLMQNVGYVVEREEVLEGDEDGVAFTVSLALFRRPEAGRELIVNADDFGQSEGINRGIIEAHTRGIVTSASLMVRHPAAHDAVAAAAAHPRLSVGLHLDLGEWRYRCDRWEPVYEVVDTGDETAVRAEVMRQVETFVRLRGRPPSHLDSHQHVHRREPVAAVVSELADALGVPLRERYPGVVYRGDFYGQTSEGSPYYEAITVDAILRVIAGLPGGCTELGCHPGYAADLDTTYAREREQELRVLTDARVRAGLEQGEVELRSFDELAGGAA